MRIQKLAHMYTLRVLMVVCDVVREHYLTPERSSACHPRVDENRSYQSNGHVGSLERGGGGQVPGDVQSI